MAEITINWIGGEHVFALKLGQLRALQTTCDAGPEQILNRIIQGAWRVDDLIEIIRLGLIGSEEFTAKEAGPFVTNLFSQHPIIEFKLPAQTALIAALVGVDGDDVGEPEGEVTPPANGSSASSTE